MRFLNTIIISIITIEIIGFTIFYRVLLHSNTDVYWGWLIFGCSIIIGFILCYISWKSITVLAIQIGAVWGFFLALILQEAVFYLIDFEYTFVIVIGACGIIGIILSLIFLNEAFNPAYAMIGAFLIARGIGMFLNYDFEFTLYY